MRKLLILGFALFMAAGSSWAQGGEKGDENRKERMAKLKRAFIEEELEMTAEESEKFMPLYDKKEKARV